MMPKPRERMTDVEYLRDLSDRLKEADQVGALPRGHKMDVDGQDIERLQFIASQLEDHEPSF